MYVMYTGIGSGFPTKLLHYLFRSNCQRLCGCVHEELAFMYVLQLCAMSRYKLPFVFVSSCYCGTMKLSLYMYHVLHCTAPCMRMQAVTKFYPIMGSKTIILKGTRFK